MGMELTTQWMREKFAEYNTKYFGGRLPMPRLIIKPLNGEWGEYIPNTMHNSITKKITKIFDSGTLILSNAIKRGEKGYINTLLHEMIHEYIFLILRKAPDNPHGEEFLSLASYINKDGWNIAESNEMEDGEAIEDAMENGEQNNQQQGSKICVGSFENPSWAERFWVFICEADNKSPYENTISKIKGATNVKYYQFTLASGKQYYGVPSILKGYGGKTFQEAIQKLENGLGEKLN